MSEVARRHAAQPIAETAKASTGTEAANCVSPQTVDVSRRPATRTPAVCICMYGCSTMLPLPSPPAHRAQAACGFARRYERPGAKQIMCGAGAARGAREEGPGNQESPPLRKRGACAWLHMHAFVWGWRQPCSVRWIARTMPVDTFVCCIVVKSMLYVCPCVDN